MMETGNSLSLMVMYEDELVEIRYKNGTQVLLAPCGSEFMLVNHPPDLHAHPLQPTERVRQRTRFTISKYKEVMVVALAFRNKYASRPYLPEELIPAEHKKPYFSIEPDVTWPEFSSVEAELGPKGSITVRSEEGRAWLELSPSGEEFTVEFTCSLSQSPNQHQNIQSLHRSADCSSESQQQASSLLHNMDDQSKPVHQGRGKRTDPTQSKLCSKINSNAQPEQRYQSSTVVQHYSCCAVPPTWSYPLSLARHQWASHLSNCKNAEGTSSFYQADKRGSVSKSLHEGRKAQFPQALPLTCSSPHWHRWKFKNPLAKEEESDLPTGLVKILWCQGVIYRVLSGAVPVVEISLGDGSVIRSNGVLNSYFTHHKPRLQAEEVKDLTYHLNSLPPDVPGQVYSLYSIVNRASRILACYNQASLLLKSPAVTPSCLQEDECFSNSTLSEQNPSSAVLMEQHMNSPQTADRLSDLVAAELEKIKRFNFLLENSHLLSTESKQSNSKESSPDVSPDPINEDYVAEALQRTSKAIQDIDALISAETLT